MQDKPLSSALTAGAAGVAVSGSVLALALAAGLGGAFAPGTAFSAIALRLGSAPLPPWFGWTFYIFAGVFVWSLFYSALEPLLPGQSLLKGSLFGFLIWIAVMVVFMPVAGLGFFALSMGVAPAILTFVTYLIYGAVVGQVLGSQRSAAAIDDVMPN